MWILVKHRHLLPPVKLMSPVGNHFLEMSGIEAILEVAIFQRINVAGSVNALMKVLLNKALITSHKHVTVLSLALRLLFIW